MWYSILIVMILWTWGLTPLWVNIVGTIFVGTVFMFQFLRIIIALCKETETE